MGFKLVTMKLTGIDIVTGLESTLSFLGQDDDFFLDVSGMRFQYNGSLPVGQRVDIKSIHIEGKKFNPMAQYTVTVNEGIAALLPMMNVTPADVEVLPIFEYNVVKDYIAKLGSVEYVAQGRIKDNSVRHLAKKDKAMENEIDETDAADATLVPAEFQLGQNYPNPFNPSTTFSVDVPSESFVSIKIFNVLGQEVATVVNENKAAGTYHYRFDASRLSSGTYIYQLKAGNVVQTKKMILMK
jgi:Secretion system C-terminal sorting domain/5'-nucleotidase, C-terminal domain